MKENLLSLALALAMCMGLVACGGGSNETPTNPEDAAGVFDDGGIQEEIGDELQPEPEPAPDLPYAEANGLSFSKEKVYTSPAFTWLADENGEPRDYNGLSISGAVDATYTIGDITVSEAGADGMVQMTIPYVIDFGTAVTADNSIYGGEVFRFSWTCETLELFDYYTGTTIDSTVAEGEVVDITHQDVTYPITCVRNVTNTKNGEFSEWVNVGGENYEDRRTYSLDITYTVTMPEEYDGLCLYLYLPGRTAPSTGGEDSDSSEVEILLDKNENAGDYALIRISDLM